MSIEHLDGVPKKLDTETLDIYILLNRDNLANVSVGVKEDIISYGVYWSYEEGVIPEKDALYETTSAWATPHAIAETHDGEIEEFDCWVVDTEAVERGNDDG